MNFINDNKYIIVALIIKIKIIKYIYIYIHISIHNIFIYLYSYLQVNYIQYGRNIVDFIIKSYSM